MRLVRHGNRQLNAAIHRIAVVQLTKDGPGRAYFQRRRAEGDTAQRALRSLKRRITRVVYNKLKAASRAAANGSSHSDRRLPQVFLLPRADLEPARKRRAELR